MSRDFLDGLRQQNSKIVSICASFPGLCHSVVGDETASLERLVKHLRSLGHERMGWLGGSPHHERHDLRLEAFRRAVTAEGLFLDPRYTVIQTESDRAAGAEAIFSLSEHQRRRDFPTVFVCYNCVMAVGAISSLEREGWTVPDDISVVGADYPRPDSAEGRRVTGAGTDPTRLGSTAVELLTRTSNHSKPSATANGAVGDTPPSGQHANGNGVAPAAEPYCDLVLPSELVVASSCGPAPA